MKLTSILPCFASILALGSTAHATAGHLISMTWEYSLDAAHVEGLKQQTAASAAFPKGSQEYDSQVNGTSIRVTTIPAGSNGITFYKIVYESVDLKGKPTTLSGQVILPAYVPQNGPVPVFPAASIVSYQHGTVTDRASAPSADIAGESMIAAFYFASRGYAVVEADYIGLGDSPGAQAYLDASTEATAARDALRASSGVFAKSKMSLTGKLFLTGYSQGGHATFALQRLLESDLNHEFKVTGSAPMAGPYNLAATAQSVIQNPFPYVTSAEIAFMVNSIVLSYGVLPDVKQAIKEPYADLFPTLFDGFHDLGQVAAKLPANPADLLLDDVRQSMLTLDPKSVIVQTLTKNNVYDWAPTAPTLFVGGGGDHEVPFDVNGLFTYNLMKANHANVVDAVSIGKLDHPDAVFPAFNYVQQWIDQLNAQ